MKGKEGGKEREGERERDIDVRETLWESDERRMCPSLGGEGARSPLGLSRVFVEVSNISHWFVEILFKVRIPVFCHDVTYIFTIHNSHFYNKYFKYKWKIYFSSFYILFILWSIYFKYLIHILFILIYEVLISLYLPQIVNHLSQHNLLYSSPFPHLFDKVISLNAISKFSPLSYIY